MWKIVSLLFVQYVNNKVPRLYEAISILNCFTETEAFAVTKDGTTLIYRNSIAMPLDIDDSVAAELIAANAMFAINVSEQFTDALLKVTDGRMSMEEFRGIFMKYRIAA